MYKVIWGPALGQYHPRLNPLMKATPLAQPGIAMKESGRMPSLDLKLASAVKVPLHTEEDSRRCTGGRKKHNGERKEKQGNKKKKVDGKTR